MISLIWSLIATCIPCKILQVMVISDCTHMYTHCNLWSLFSQHTADFRRQQGLIYMYLHPDLMTKTCRFATGHIHGQYFCHIQKVCNCPDMPTYNYMYIAVINTHTAQNTFPAVLFSSIYSYLLIWLI